MDVKRPYSRCFRGHNLHSTVTVFCAISPVSFFLCDKFILFFKKLKRTICTLLLCDKKYRSPCSFKRKGPFISLSSLAWGKFLLTRKSCAVEMRNAILRNQFKLIITWVQLLLQFWLLIKSHFVLVSHTRDIKSVRDKKVHRKKFHSSLPTEGKHLLSEWTWRHKKHHLLTISYTSCAQSPPHPFKHLFEVPYFLYVM